MLQNITETRSAEVAIYLPKYNLSKCVKVTQNRFIPSIELSQSELYFTADGGTQNNITISANFEYEVKSSSNSSWLSFKKINNTLIIKASQNLSTQINRSEEIIVYNELYNVSQTITVVQYPYKLGDIVDINGAKGVVGFVGSTTTLIISVKETRNKDWYDAKYWCLNYGSGWHLPSLDDLDSIYVATINSTLSANGYTTINTEYNNWYWSSTEYNSYGAYGICFAGGWSNISKDRNSNNIFVRACYSF